MKEEEFKVLITSIKASIELEKEMMYHTLRLWGLSLGLTRELTAEEMQFAEELASNANKELYAQIKNTSDLLYSHFYPNVTWEQSRKIDDLCMEAHKNREVFNRRWDELYEEYLEMNKEDK